MYACCAKLLPSCLILCNPMDCSLPGSSIPGILQARTVEWVAISFPNAWKWKVKVRSLSHVWLLVTSWTAAYQAPPSMGFSRQEYWSGVPVSHWEARNYHMTQKSHDWAYILRKPQFKETYVLQCPLQHYWQQPEHGRNLDVRRQVNGKRSCGAYTQWNITQP